MGRHQTIAMWGTGDRRRLFVTSREDNETYMLDAERLRVLRRWPVGDFAGTVSADGSVFALGSPDGAVGCSICARDGSEPSAAATTRACCGCGSRPTRGRSSRPGTTGVIVWDVARGTIRQVLSGHVRGLVWGLDVAPDGRTAYSAGGTARVRLGSDRRPQPRPPVCRSTALRPDDGDVLPRGIALTPDGRTLAVGHSDGMVDLLDARTLRRRRRFRALRGFVGALAFSPDGSMLAATGQHGQLTLWDARTLRARGELRGQTPRARRSPSRLTARCWPAAEVGTFDSHTQAARPRLGPAPAVTHRHVSPSRLSATAIAFNRDGRLLVIVGRGTPHGDP